MTPYTAVVIGLGNIGMRYDYALDPKRQILTHCSAYYHHPHFELLAAVDPDPQSAKLFERKYQKPAFPSIQALAQKYTPEVISFCVPYPIQPKTVQETLDWFVPKAVLLEKPLAATYQEAHTLIQRLESIPILSLVNYIRRFEPGAQSVRQKIKNQEIGALKRIVGWYTHSLYRNGCHLIDFIHYCLCDKDSTPLWEIGRRTSEILSLKLDDIPVTLHLSPPPADRFEMHFIGESGTLSYTRRGEDIRLTQFNPGSNLLETVLPNDLLRYQWYVQEALSQGLRAPHLFSSTGRTALHTEQLLSRLAALKELS